MGPTRANKRATTTKSKAPGAASSLLEASARELQLEEEAANVKLARTPSGGAGPTGL